MFCWMVYSEWADWAGGSGNEAPGSTLEQCVVKDGRQQRVGDGVERRGTVQRRVGQSDEHDRRLQHVGVQRQHQRR